jgi:hypothetical protein
MTDLDIDSEIPSNWEVNQEPDNLDERSKEYKFTYAGGEISASIVQVLEDEYRVIFWHNNTTSELVEEEPKDAISLMLEHMREISNADNAYLYFKEHLYQPDDRWG